MPSEKFLITRLRLALENLDKVSFNFIQVLPQFGFAHDLKKSAGVASQSQPSTDQILSVEWLGYLELWGLKTLVIGHNPHENSAIERRPYEIVFADSSGYLQRKHVHTGTHLSPLKNQLGQCLSSSVNQSVISQLFQGGDKSIP